MKKVPAETAFGFWIMGCLIAAALSPMFGIGFFTLGGIIAMLVSE